MLLAVAADREFLPDHVIFSITKIPKDVLFLTSENRFLHAFPSGWMICELFTEIMLESIIPAMKKRRIDIRVNKSSNISGLVLTEKKFL